MDLSIIFVNWNAVAYLRECLASIYANTRAISFEVIVVDNASPEGNVDTLQPEFPKIQIIKSDQNVGFAAANNVGFKKSTGEYVLFLNPDTKLIGPTINTLFDWIERLPDAGIVGCKMLNSDLSVQVTSIQKFPTILNQIVNSAVLQRRWPGCPIWNISPLFSDLKEPVKVEVVPGACMLLRRSAFEKVGMFSEDYFMYAEDIDLNHKLARAGLSNYYVGEAQIIHYGGRSSSQQKVNQWATMMKYRAMTRYYRKTKGPFYELMYRVSTAIVAIGRLALFAVLYPFANVIWNKQAFHHATEKWVIILKWAIGRQSLVLGDR